MYGTSALKKSSMLFAKSVFNDANISSGNCEYIA
jgi:hypothetical protein